jgi:hypothetical protein
MNSYAEGSLVRVAGAFTNAAGSSVDPGTVTFYYQPPSGSASSYVYGTDAELVKASTGNYYVDLNTTDAPGIWLYAFRATGSGQSAAEGRFHVEPSNFF